MFRQDRRRTLAHSSLQLPWECRKLLFPCFREKGLLIFRSLEFFTFPAYMNDVAATTTCLQNMKDLTGTWPPLRIGGTTQCVVRSPWKDLVNVDREQGPGHV